MKSFKPPIILTTVLALLSQQVWAQFPPKISLSEFNHHTGITLTNRGENTRAEIKTIGDFNHDGLDDLIIGGTTAVIAQQEVSGCVIIFGQPGGLPAELDMTLIDGNNGFFINMDTPNNSSFYAVNGLGDINHDGIDDLIIGDFSANLNGDTAGAAFVLFGHTGPVNGVMNISSLDGSNGFKIPGLNAMDQTGFRVNIIDDFNGDAIDDLIIGANLVELDLASPDRGAVYVVFGSQQAFPAQFDLAALNGNNGMVIYGEQDFDELSSDMTAADINGDGLSDIILTAPGHTQPGGINGKAYAVFGSSQALPMTFDLNSLNGTNGFIIETVDGAPPNFVFDLISIQAVGDFNHDGIEDMAIAYPTAAVAGNKQAGIIYLVYGSQAPFASNLDLTSLDGNNGFKIYGLQEFDFLGYATNAVGDVNADGIDDMIMTTIHETAPNFIDPFDAAYVLFGQDQGMPATFDVTTLNGHNGFVIESVDGRVASVLNYVAAAADANQDGIADFALSTNESGFIVYGRGDLIYQSSFD